VRRLPEGPYRRERPSRADVSAPKGHTAGTTVNDADSRLVIVGVGADGWSGLGEQARAALKAARTIVGSQRQLDLLPAELAADRRLWPSPIGPLVEELIARAEGSPCAQDLARTEGPSCVLASGDPMLHGIGATLAQRLGPDRMVVHPHTSAFALACARLGWPASEVELLSAVGQPPELVVRLLQPGRRLVVYAAGADGASGVARVLCERGFGPSRLVVLEQLGGVAERILESTADSWGDATADPLHTIAIECRAGAGTPLLPLIAGLPDEAYETDGQLTKRHLRAAALAALVPLPGVLLWDVGAGSGSIAIEWLRAEPSAAAIAVESHEERAALIESNAQRLGVPALRVVRGHAPQVLDGLPRPDAVFIGGGLTSPGLIERCWTELAPGGRIVANAVTIEGEQALLAARAAHGGELVRIAVSHAEPLGGFEAWRAQLPVVQWSARREVE
jgi:precorrin-6B C5,15-methyltransferase / cobalt-precorrin-6B C5,C15-methyltransferase